MSTDTSWGQVLDEPMPCDTCRHFETCRFTGSACRAYQCYVEPKRGDWREQPREPDVRIGERLGLKAAPMTDADRARLLAKVAIVP